MKAQLLGKLDIKAVPVQDRKAAKKLTIRDKKWPGEVEPIGLSVKNPYIQALLDFGAEHGFKYKECHLYTGACLLPLDGSVLWHDDSGIGHILCWVIEVEKFGSSFAFSRDTPALLSTHKQKVHQLDRLKVGDVFVFNGDYGHAWLSNESCVLVQVTVSAPRASLQGSTVAS
jgi:hypothetical protein